MLILTGFLLLMLFLFASGMFAAAVAGQRAERVFLPVLILNAFLLYIAAACHRAEAGFAVILTANLALYIPVIFRMKREGIRTVLNRFLTPGIIFALIFLTGFFILTLWRKFYSWDEISHWGAAAQLFFRDGKLGCEYPRHILSHASYPPGSCMVSVLVHYCFFGQPFSEGLVIFSHELLSLGAFVMVYAALKWKNQLQMILLTFPVLFLSAMAKVYAYDYCYTDLMLALTMAVAFYHSVNIDRCTGTEIFFLALLLGALPMLRNAGWQYCISLYILLAVTGFIHRKKLFYRTGSPRCSAGRIMLFACCFLA